MGYARPSGATSFEQDAAAVLNAMRNAFGALLAAVPGGVRKPTDLKRALRIDAKLAWRVFKLGTAADPMTSACHVPGLAAMRTFLKAAGDRGLPSDVVESAECTIADFERLIEVHAGDRGSFDSMISACADESPSPLDLEHKRAAFRANSHLWGVQARTQLGCWLIHPGAEPGMIDLASIRGFVGLRRFRANASWVVSRIRVIDDDGTARRSIVREAFDADAEAEHGVSLLRAFCTDPLPPLRTYTDAEGYVCTELVGNEVGNASAVTCITGDVSRNAGSCYRGENNRVGGGIAGVRTPCEVLIHDLLVCEGTFGTIDPRVFVEGDIRGRPVRAPGQGSDRLCVHESVDYLGRGASVLHTPDVPRYSAMAGYAFDKLGWDGERFDVYRCRVQYPVMPSKVVIEFDLPERPPRPHGG